MRTLIIDSQILTTYQECGQKYQNAFIEHLRPNHPVDPLVKGDVLHKGLEGYYRYLMNELKGDQDRSLIHAAGVELAIEDANIAAARNGINLDLAEEVIKAMTQYLEFYQNDDIVPLAVEEPFVLEMYYDETFMGEGLRILYAGKIDLVATASRYQWQPTPFDNKSTTRNTTASTRSNQFFGYTVALNSNLLVVNRIGFQKTLSAAERFKRIPLSYPEEYRENWRQQTLVKWGKKLALALERHSQGDPDAFEENVSSCDKFSGCQFKPICEAVGEEAKEWIIQSQFMVGEPWDVTKVLGIKVQKDEQTTL